MRPAAGVVGMVASPMQGAWKSIQRVLVQRQEQKQHLRNTRISDGVEAVKNSSKVERALILEKFREAKRDTGERQKKYRDFAEKVMYEDEHPGDAERDPLNASPKSSSGPSREALASSSLEGIVNDEDAAFARDMEVAKKLSLAEQ